jgi:hypothetical protein
VVALSTSTTVKHDCLNSEVVGSRNGNGISGDWKMVGSYQTVEHAKEAVDQLTAAGIESKISMIGGLSVITKR